MNKILLSIGTIFLATVPTVVVVSCSSNDSYSKRQQIESNRKRIDYLQTQVDKLDYLNHPENKSKALKLTEERDKLLALNVALFIALG